MSNIPEILKSTHTIAVVGLSNNHMRPSNGVGEYLVRVGYRVIPVNPNESEVLGEKSYARLEDVPEKIDMVIFELGRRFGLFEHGERYATGDSRGAQQSFR